MLVDNITLTVKAGDGGNGAVAFLRNEGNPKGGPDGGNGGNGGNVFFQGSHNLTDLREFRFKKKIAAEDGIRGKKKKLFGKNAPHLTIFVPVGTKITDLQTERIFEIADTATPVLLAQGGKGGRGNDEFKSATNQTPMRFEEGTPGEVKELHLELKMIADIGLVGLPNAGKSSLLSVLTKAEPKIGNYPFTTLEPSIGMMGTHPVADIPGLIEGASQGRGLGITFLKHIEKTKMLVHCIDATGETPEKTYQTVRKEFGEYNAALLEKPELIVLTKIDLADPETVREAEKKLSKFGEVLLCSLYQPETIRELKNAIVAKLDQETDEIKESIVE